MAEASYLITGGLGGLGLTIAEWLIDQGARHLILTGRRGAAALDADHRAALASLQGAGVTIETLAIDVVDAAQMAELLADFAHRPPLRGVIHCAGVLDDATLLQQTPPHFRTAFAPKLDGAWNLHMLTRDQTLDFFVVFSSAASILGSPGQANYAAANAFLDALAQQRWLQGLPALSINWGPWAEVGLAARGRAAGGFNVGGIQALTPPEGVAAFAQIIDLPLPQVGVLALNVRQWRQFYPKVAQIPLLRILLAEESYEHPLAQRFVGRLEALPVSDRLPALIDHVIEHVAQVLRIPIASIEAQTPLSALGLDSLMGLELRNRLEDSLGVAFSVTTLWNYETIQALAKHLAERLQLAVAPELDPPTPVVAPDLGQDDELAALLAQIADLSIDELSQLARGDNQSL